MNNKSIIIERLDYKYGDNFVLQNINLEIEEGDYVGLIGPNGGGKSTLLKLIAGILKPHSGHIHVYDKIGYVPQKLSSAEKIFPATVLEIVKSGDPHNKDEKKLSEIFKKLGIEKLKDKLIGNLSGGQLQKVLIARALMPDPKILILDEATVGIDPRSRENFQEILHNLNKEKITIILASHDLNVVTKEVKTVLCLNKTLICEGPPTRILTETNIESLYGGNVKFVHHNH